MHTYVCWAAYDIITIESLKVVSVWKTETLNHRGSTTVSNKCKIINIINLLQKICIYSSQECQWRKSKKKNLYEEL
jgi:hypothetical protein